MRLACELPIFVRTGRRKKRTLADNHFARGFYARSLSECSGRLERSGAGVGAQRGNLNSRRALVRATDAALARMMSE